MCLEARKAAVGEGLLFFISSLPFPSPPQACSTRELESLPCLPPWASPSAPPRQGLRRAPGQPCAEAAAAARPPSGAAGRHQTNRPSAGGALRAPALGARSGAQWWKVVAIFAPPGASGPRAQGRVSGTRLELPAEPRAGRCASAGPGQTP